MISQQRANKHAQGTLHAVLSACSGSLRPGPPPGTLMYSNALEEALAELLQGLLLAHAPEERWPPTAGLLPGRGFRRNCQERRTSCVYMLYVSCCIAD